MRKANLEQITNAIINFNLEGTVRSVTPYGNGHINDTFLVTCYKEDDSKHEYILQAVNNDVFKLPAQVMENIVKVDARGLSCPQPVILTMEALKKNADGYEIVVDNHTAEQNVTRFLKKAGKSVEVAVEGEDIILTAK